MDQSIIRATAYRIFLFLLKGILGLLMLALVFLILIHTPIVQQWITSKVSKYLVETTAAKVTIKEINFSLWGEISIMDIDVKDPEGVSLLSSDVISVNPDLLQILRGNFNLDYVELIGTRGQLINSGDQLNIGFFIDAFKSGKRDDGKEAKSFNLQVDRLKLENIHFEYHSIDDSLDLVVDLGLFESQNFGFNINPNRISTKNALLEQAEISMLSYKKPEKKDTLLLPPLDFGSGFDFELDHIELINNSFSIHQDKVIETEYFDPNHLVLMGVDLEAADVVLRKDSMALDLKRFSTMLPGFPSFDLGARINSNLVRLDLSDFALSTGDSRIDMELAASFGDFSNILNEFDGAKLDLSVHSTVNRKQLGYFLADSVLDRFGNWDQIEWEIAGRYDMGHTEIDTMKMVLGKSTIFARGNIDSLSNLDNASWNDLNISIVLGPELKRFAAPYHNNLKLPEELLIQLKSSGLMSGFEFESQISSTWGTIGVKGKAGVNQQTMILDLSLEGEGIQAGEFLDLDWLGPSDLSLQAVGKLGNIMDLKVEGQIDRLVISETEINDIDINGSYNTSEALVNIMVRDTAFSSEIQTEIAFEGPLSITTSLHLDHFGLGKLVNQDSSMLITSTINSKIIMENGAIEGLLDGESISFISSTKNYSIDSLYVNLMTSATGSSLNLYSDDLIGKAKANFDFREGPDVVNDIVKTVRSISDSAHRSEKNRKLNFDFEVQNVTPLKLFNNEFEDFNSMKVSGEYDELSDLVIFEAQTSQFNGFGIALDTLYAHFNVLPNGIDSRLFVRDILYDSIKVGNLDFRIKSEEDKIVSDFNLTQDSTSILVIGANLLKEENGYNIYIDSLFSLNEVFSIDPSASIFVGPNNLTFNNLVLTNDDLEIAANGGLDNFELSINNADLTHFNYFLKSDSMTIGSGILNGIVSYSKSMSQLDLQATIDSLTINDAPPISIALQANTEGGNIPILFQLTSSTNNIELIGDYSTHDSRIEALMKLDIDDLNTFQILLQKKIERLSGQVDGEIGITGTLNEPKYRGSLRFNDTYITTAKPRSTFHLKDEVITLDNSELILDDFTIYDQNEHPLTLNGVLRTEDYESFEYDLSLDTDNYLLINNPRTDEFQLQGMLVLGTNLKLTGNENDTNVEAKIIIKDTTDLTYVKPQANLELITNEGIVEFIDPAHTNDSLITTAQSFYDSLVSTIPSFNLTSKITLQDQVLFRVVVDSRSGDFIEVAGAANLDLEIDRTGNIQLNGTYSITRGFYQLSFYDMVKKRFDLTPGSSINWTGNPDNGNLDLKAVHSIKTSSIGLIGHEIGENEKSIYRKPLPYEVAIVIGGTIESPEISFTLDLPKEEKVNYPALESKLNRLKQPEFESELNKQVFGLLVMGGFLPETSGSDFDQSLVATTALSNSVNSILASQLNRFASQFVKGVDINVGLQSYADFTSGGGGQTRTAMDFRVTKRMMDDRLSVEVGGDFDINADQSGARSGSDNFRGDITVIYDLTESGTKKLKAFNNETYDIIYHEIRNTGISLIFIREFDKGEKRKK